VVKKTLQIAATVGVLLAGYAGYVRGFAILAAQYKPAIEILPHKIGFQRLESQTTKQARELAVEEFGKGHWTHDAKQSSIQFIDTQRGYWFYAGAYERKGEGKTIEFSPFAVVSLSKDGRKRQTITGKKAILDFDQPFNLTKPGAGGKASRVVHARVIDDVVIRDNKGTRTKADDLVVDRLTYLEYDEKALTIASESPVRLRDRDMLTTGVGLTIALRPIEDAARPGGAAFSGAETIWLSKEIHIHVDDVGQTGILPGASPAAGGAAHARTPLELTCDGPMRIDMPKPATPVKVGPPEPAGPTVARFKNNVRVRRGAVAPDELTSDTLQLTLIPAPKAAGPPVPAPEGAEGDPAAGGPLTELTLRKAVADGHAVWLRSEAQGSKALCNHLIHTKSGPDRPDETYLSADRGQVFRLEKIDYVADAKAGKDQGELDLDGEPGGGVKERKIREITFLEAADVTLFQDNAAPGKAPARPPVAGQIAGPGRVVARGPGWMETRPARDKPVERRATWQDAMVMETKSQDVEPHRLVTLTGRPTMVSPTQGDLRARDKIILSLVPKPAGAPTPAAADNTAQSASQGHQLKWMQAWGDVHMVSAPPAEAAAAKAPPKKTMHAREWLFVKFEPQAAAVAAAAAAPATPAAAAPTLADDSTPAADQAIAATPAPEAIAQAQADEAGPPPLAEAKPADPDMDVQAERVWARVVQGDGTNKGEVRQVFLRGDVAVHQGPAPGKAQGTDIFGEKVDLTNKGIGRAVVLAHGADGGGWAKAVTEESVIEGPILMLDQAEDFATVIGPGHLVQKADRNPAGGPTAGAPARKPADITWQKEMLFFGRTTVEETGQPGPAQARFFGNVLAITENDRISCRGELDANFDQPIAFNRGARDPKSPRPAAPEPKAQVVSFHGTDQVRIASYKTDARTGDFLQLQRVYGNKIFYDRPSGSFWVDDKGDVLLYELADKPAETQTPGAVKPAAPPRDLKPLGAADAPVGDGRVLRVAAGPAPGRAPANVRAVPAPPGAAKPRAKPKPDPLLLTQIHFDRGMKGQFVDAATAKANGNPAEAGRREAQFYGGVEVLRARVANEDIYLNSDKSQADLMVLVAQNPDQRKPSLTVDTDPAPPKSQAKARTLLTAYGEAVVRNQGNTIYADTIKFNSLTELALAEGLNGNPVGYTRQDAPGQPVSANSGQAYLYNLKTGEGHVEAPGAFQMFEKGKGIRPGSSGPTPDAKPIKPKRLKPMLPIRSDLNRRGFMGR